LQQFRRSSTPCSTFGRI